MKIQKTKNFGVPEKNKFFLTIGTSNPLRGLIHLESGSTNKFFLNFCYLDIFSEKLTFSKKVHFKGYKLP
jgi:hypothetical protein